MTPLEVVRAKAQSLVAAGQDPYLVRDVMYGVLLVRPQIARQAAEQGSGAPPPYSPEEIAFLGATKLVRAVLSCLFQGYSGPRAPFPWPTPLGQIPMETWGDDFHFEARPYYQGPGNRVNQTQYILRCPHVVGCLCVRCSGAQPHVVACFCGGSRCQVQQPVALSGAPMTPGATPGAPTI